MKRVLEEGWGFTAKNGAMVSGMGGRPGERAPGRWKWGAMREWKLRERKGVSLEA